MNDMTLTEARALDTPALLAALKGALAGAEEQVRRACVALAVLEERGVDLPPLPEVYRFAREIAEGQLSPHAAWLLGGIRGALRTILPLPLDLQDRIADGLKVKIAVRAKGRIVSAERTIYEMREGERRLAFGEDGITPWEEQGAYLHKTGNQEPEAKRPNINVDARTGDIVVGRVHLTVADLMPALAALGYQVKPIYGRQGLTPAKVR